MGTEGDASGMKGDARETKGNAGGTPGDAQGAPGDARRKEGNAYSITAEQLQSAVAEALAGKDANSMSFGKGHELILRRELEQKFGLAEQSLEARKDEVQQMTLQTFQRIAQMQKQGSQQKDTADVQGASPRERVDQGDDSRGTEAGASQKPRSKSKAANKASGSMTKKRFLDNASPFIIPKGAIGDKEIKIAAKSFSTGSSGWHASSKAKIDVDGEEVNCQVNLQMIIVGSKEWPEGC